MADPRALMLKRRTAHVVRLRAALKRFVKMVDEDQILVKNEDRAELIETLAQANEAINLSDDYREDT